MGYTAYDAVDVYEKRIQVAGGGIGNGNAYAEVQIKYADADMERIKGVYYVEFGNNPVRKYIGNDVEWCEDDNFKVLNGGKYVDVEDEDDEDEEDEDGTAPNQEGEAYREGRKSMIEDLVSALPHLEDTLLDVLDDKYELLDVLDDKGEEGACLTCKGEGNPLGDGGKRSPCIDCNGCGWQPEYKLKWQLEHKELMAKKKCTLQIKCRECDEPGWYEDIRDDYKGKPDYEYGICSECEQKDMI